MYGSVETAASADVAEARSEKDNSKDRSEQARVGKVNSEEGVGLVKGKKANEKAGKEPMTTEVRAEDRGIDEAGTEACSLCLNPVTLDGDGLGPSVGIIVKTFSSDWIATAVKKLNQKIRITLAVTKLDRLTDDEERILRSVEILLVQPAAIVNSPLFNHLPNLKWMHSILAGVDQILKVNNSTEKPPAYILTRNVGCFERQMAEYVVGMIVARERHFREFWESQLKKFWNHKRMRSLSDVALAIVGFGSIGKEVARMAKIFGLRVWALVRSLPTESTRCPDVDEYRLVPDLGDLLSSCDYVVSLLPSTPSTDGFFDGDTLSKGKTKKPVFMNIGRGNVISNSTVLHALSEGWISHAILDVFETEPLATESPLWTHPQVTVTPHVSGQGFTDKQLLGSFLENYDRYTSGRDLLHTVDWKKGY